MKMTPQELISELKNGKKKKIILDSDAYNEVDDQYAIAYSMLSPDRVEILSINAAPFLNKRSTSAGDGMEKSYQELMKILTLMEREDLKYCPHGRPICVSLSKKQLEKQFKRV